MAPRTAQGSYKMVKQRSKPLALVSCHHWRVQNGGPGVFARCTCLGDEQVAEGNVSNERVNRPMNKAREKCDEDCLICDQMGQHSHASHFVTTSSALKHNAISLNSLQKSGSDDWDLFRTAKCSGTMHGSKRSRLLWMSSGFHQGRCRKSSMFMPNICEENLYSLLFNRRLGYHACLSLPRHSSKTMQNQVLLQQWQCGLCCVRAGWADRLTSVLKGPW